MALKHHDEQELAEDAVPADAEAAGYEPAVAAPAAADRQVGSSCR